MAPGSAGRTRRAARSSVAAMSLLAFRQVSKRFADGAGEIAVLDRVSFEVEVGETVGLLCSRRGGKTTLLMLAAGLIAPTEGSVLWDQEFDLGAMKPDDRARFRRRRWDRSDAGRLAC